MALVMLAGDVSQRAGILTFVIWHGEADAKGAAFPFPAVLLFFFACDFNNYAGILLQR